jgi:putative DNA methylase
MQVSNSQFPVPCSLSPITCPMKKLIEVALPLEAINEASAREKSIRHGHPSTLHLWWARRPLAACRAVLFASLVDDPGEYIPDPAQAHAERERLFGLITELVQWENSKNEDVLDRARLEIARSVARNLGVDVPIGKEAVREFLATKAPPVLDPFAGGGSIPLEAQRLGLRAYASDLNPVAVLINKALIEIPPRFANQPPVHPSIESENAKAESGNKKSNTTQLRLEQREWKGAAGLAEDVRYYGKWMRDEAEKRIGHLYPKVTVDREQGTGDREQGTGKSQFAVPSNLSPKTYTVIAWLWARTVKCPNPACGAMMPLVRSFELSKKKGKQAWVEPLPPSPSPNRRGGEGVRFQVHTGNGHAPEGTVNRRGARCIVCGTSVPFEHIRAEGKANRMSAQLMAIVAEGERGRVYVSPNDEHARIAASARPAWTPDTDLPEQALGFRVQLYGMTKHRDLFTPRQLVALTTFSDLVSEARERVKEDAIRAGIKDDGKALNDGGSGASAYADAVATYLAFAVSKTVNRCNTIATWKISVECPGDMFTRQSIQMTWDFAESNVVSGPSGSFDSMLENTVAGLQSTEIGTSVEGRVEQHDATTVKSKTSLVISTDPPYYDNIGYADISDIFYVWLRKSLAPFYPRVFGTVLVPKTEELVATPYRFGGSKDVARKFFEHGLVQVFENLRKMQQPQYPLTVYYAFKQSEAEDDEESNNDIQNSASTGWETMLNGLIESNFSITGTWPMRTERGNRTVAMDTNALASSIVLVCRPRPEDAPRTTRREFLAALKKELAPALRELQQGNIAPVDLAQAAIGPGMAIFSKYREVLEPDGTPMRVRTALALINQALDEYLTEQEGEYDADTRWALAWFEQYGHEAGPFGVAETLSKAKNTGIDGLVRAGILASRGGQVHLLSRDELPETWDPRTDARLTAWESVQYLVRALDKEGEAAAAALLKKLGSHADTTRDLAYRLYTLCERKGWAQDALGYNMLVVAWNRLADLAARGEVKQDRLQGIGERE